MSRPTLLIVDPSVAMTGAFRAVSNSAKALAGHADIILALPRGTTIDPAEFAPFKRVVFLPLRTVRRTAKDLVLYLPALLSSALSLRRILRVEATHLFVNDFYMMHGAVLRSLGYRGFIGAFVRLNPAAFPRSISRAFLDRLWSSSDTIIAVSRHLMNALPATTKMRVIYDPIDASPGTGPSTRIAGEGKAVLLYYANIIRGKGQEHAIAAFEKIAGDYPAAELHFVGGDMGQTKNMLFRDELEVLADSTAFADRIFFHGFASDPQSVFASSDVALLFSESETLGHVGLEASLSGLPVIATRCGGPEEFVVDGVTGHLVPRGDIDAMAARMSELLADPDKAREMGRGGTAFVTENFSAERFRAAFMDALGVAAPAAGKRQGA